MAKTRSKFVVCQHKVNMYGPDWMTILGGFLQVETRGPIILSLYYVVTSGLSWYHSASRWGMRESSRLGKIFCQQVWKQHTSLPSAFSWPNPATWYQPNCKEGWEIVFLCEKEEGTAWLASSQLCDSIVFKLLFLHLSAIAIVC